MFITICAEFSVFGKSKPQLGRFCNQQALLVYKFHSTVFATLRQCAETSSSSVICFPAATETRQPGESDGGVSA